MKKNKFLNGLTLLAIAFMAILGSCVDNDFDTPATREIPVGQVVTVAQLKTFFTDSGAVFINSAVGNAYEFKRDITVYATVTMDDKTGNLYEMAYIQDPTGGIALKFDVPGGIQEGDTVRLNVKGLIINQYAKAFQINAIHGEGFKKENYITTIDVNKFRVPEIATIAQITNSANKAYYQGRLVKIENTQFVAGDTMQTYADYANFISRNLNIEEAGGSTLLVRTSGYASFADEKSPKGSGSIIGVMGQYNNDMQMQIRKTSEVVMTSDRLGGGGTGIDPIGSGTFADPYNVSKAMQSNTGEDLWVQGYIVGVYETVDAGGANLAEFVPSFTAPFNTNSNIIIADTQDETNIANCVVVQLPSGDIRTALNLKDVSANKGKQVKVLGDLMAYFGFPGVKNTSGYWMDGAGIIPATGFYTEDFATTLGSYTGFSVSGAQVWTWNSYDSGNAKISGYTTVNNANEDWLVSPNINLTGKTNVKLVIREAIKYITTYDDLRVQVSTNYDGTSNPSTQGTWTTLTGFTRPVGSDWNFVSSGDIDLSAYDGSATFYISFKYVSTTAGGATWEVGNVLLKEGSK